MQTSPKTQGVEKGEDAKKDEGETPGHPNVIYMVAVCATIGGLLFGYDTGIINGALLLLKKQYGLSTAYSESIVASTVGTAAIFSLFAGATADSWGRKPTIMMAAATFAVGAAFMGFAPDASVVLIGRIIVGSSIGFVSAIVPVYVSECAPQDIRGRLITLNQLFITIGILLSAIIAGALQTLGEMGWRLMLGLAAIPGVLQLLMFIYLPDSPRYMMMKQQTEKAEATLKWIRASDDVTHELQDIQESLEEEKDTKGMMIVYKIFTTPHVRKALFIGCMLQLFQQFCGINTVIYYSASILLVAGFNEHEAIWLACIPFTVNFLATFLGLWAVETLGRKWVLAISFLAIGLSLVVLSYSFILAENDSPEANSTLYESLPASLDHCFKHKTCHGCISEKGCGFCYREVGTEFVEGSCVSMEESGTFAIHGRCFGDPQEEGNDTLIDGLHIRRVCPSKHAWISVLGLILYVLFFAPGAGPMPWTINAEIYPSWARGTANSLATVTNWTCNLIVSYSFLSFIETMGPEGTFIGFAVVCVVAAIFVLVMVPETKDKSLEEIECLFMTPQAREKAMALKTDREAGSPPPAPPPPPESTPPPEPEKEQEQEHPLPIDPTSRRESTSV